MTGGSARRIGYGGVVAAVLGVFAGSLLLAQAVENQPATAVATTQPAEAPAPTTAPAVETPAAAVREPLTTGLIGSKHDFTRGGRTGRDLCLPCHTPHQVLVPPPRLDHRPGSIAPLRPFRGFHVELTGWSLLCLSCHDGVMARDVYASAHAITTVSELGNARLGKAGLRSHPVGIQYPAAAERYEPLTAVTAAGLLLEDGRIQCTTCHDAHNTHRHRHMLRISNDGSRLCLTCHRL